VQLQQARTRLASLPPADLLEEARSLVDAARARQEKTATDYQERHSAWVRDLQDAKTRRESLRDQYKDLREQLERITQAGPEGNCPTCARPLGKEYRTVLDELTQQLQDVEFNGGYFKKKVEQLSASPPELAELEKQRDAIAREAEAVSAELTKLRTLAKDGATIRKDIVRLEKEVARLERQAGPAAGDFDPTRLAEVRRLMNELEPLALQAERLRVAADHAGKLVLEAESAEKQLSEHEAGVKEVQAKLAAVGYSEAVFTAARTAWETSERDKRQAELGIMQAQMERKAAGEQAKDVERRRADRGKREEEARQAARDVALYNELDKAFTDLRNDLNLAMRPDLSELASEFVRDLTNNRYSEVELDEDYVATLVEAGDPRPVISGGEEDIASLALRLAISRMIADTAGQPLSLLVLDEIFGSLDEQRREAVMNLLRGLGDRFPQVILITHIDAAGRDADRVIHVEYDADSGSARVREETAGVTDGLAA
jgi:exonuclease SbcC